MLWGANKAGDGRVEAKGGFQLDFIPKDNWCADTSLTAVILETESFLGADKGRGNSSHWSILVWVCTHLRLERCPSLATHLVEHMSVCCPCLQPQALQEAAVFCCGPVHTATTLGLSRPSKEMLKVT